MLPKYTPEYYHINSIHQRIFAEITLLNALCSPPKKIIPCLVLPVAHYDYATKH